MKLPRVSILAIMAAVVVLAVDCLAVRTVEARGPFVGPFDSLVCVALPMANVLSIGLALWLRGPGRRPFLRGFVIVGAIALGAVIADVVSGTYWVENRAEAILGPLLKGIDGDKTPVLAAIVEFGAPAALILLPQLLIAVLGGLGSLVLDRRRLAPDAAPISRRHRLRSLAASMMLVVVPVLAMEGYFRASVDPATARLPAGTVATLPLDALAGLPDYPGNETASSLGAARVRVDRDQEIDQLGAILGDPWYAPMRAFRRVAVTPLDGRRAGDSVQLLRCQLRPSR